MTQELFLLASPIAFNFLCVPLAVTQNQCVWPIKRKSIRNSLPTIGNLRPSVARRGVANHVCVRNKHPPASCEHRGTLAWAKWCSRVCGTAW